MFPLRVFKVRDGPGAKGLGSGGGDYEAKT